MNNVTLTEQETFWKGAFGNEYTSRNRGQYKQASNIALFAKILTKTQGITSVIEFGANIGLNLKAIKQILPASTMKAVEINEQAVLELQKIPEISAHHQSIFDYDCNQRSDFVLVKGILIHINQDKLKDAYRVLYETSKKYICIVEYYNPIPTTVNYRGFSNKLFKRDFAGEILDTHKNLKLIDYGFVYHRDSNFPQDDMTWFLLEKNC